MPNPEQLTVYTSRFCGHSRAVEQFLKGQNVPATFICIDDDAKARQKVVALNNGYASVPTLIFPDGTHLTEPSTRQLRAKLGLETDSLTQKLRNLIRK